MKCLNADVEDSADNLFFFFTLFLLEDSASISEGKPKKNNPIQVNEFF